MHLNDNDNDDDNDYDGGGGGNNEKYIRIPSTILSQDQSQPYKVTMVLLCLSKSYRSKVASAIDKPECNNSGELTDDDDDDDDGGDDGDGDDDDDDIPTRWYMCFVFINRI